MNLEADLRAVGIIPVVALDRVEDAIPLVDAMAAGGLPCAEITFRTAAAAGAIAAIRAERPNILIGAGTILSIAQADAAIEAGASFLVAPGFNPAVVRHALDRGIPIVPGVCTPSEIEVALGFGLTLLKFFPAGPIGGPAYIKALIGPYPMISFVPTGGITIGNMGEYLAIKAVVAVGGTWLTKAEMVRAGDFAGVEALARQAIEAVAAARGGVAAAKVAP
jgi:2-dehydro-3-deoxyphosphogluconate aldolase / (4S)-4-hydroxy-2-oxoglutarate aldolase